MCGGPALCATTGKVLGILEGIVPPVSDEASTVDAAGPGMAVGLDPAQVKCVCARVCYKCAGLDPARALSNAMCTVCMCV